MQKLTQAGILFLYTHSLLFMWLHWLLVAAYGSSPLTRDKTWGNRGGGITQPQQEGSRTHLQTQWAVVSTHQRLMRLPPQTCQS